MQSAIKDKFDHVATLIEGGGGAFEVRVDASKLVFSNPTLKTSRFPENDEIFDAIASLQSA